jgi:hypothetical protein
MSVRSTSIRLLWSAGAAYAFSGMSGGSSPAREECAVEAFRAGADPGNKPTAPATEREYFLWT